MLKVGLKYHVPGKGSIREAEEHVRNLAGENQKALQRTLNTGLVGSPKTITRKIEKLEDAGVNHLFLHFTPTLPEFKHFADEVLPLLNR